ncbi:hypothetical protein AEGHOMDF_1936 [Methylobacterium soli]|nr:hypothetical protein AEGHOMDF_1936 [Methylobacterium soli]
MPRPEETWTMAPRLRGFMCRKAASVPKTWLR